MVEGLPAIERLLALIDEWDVRSLVLLPKVAERLAGHIDTAGIDRSRVSIADEALLRRVVGFDLHRGALASVERIPPLTTSEAIQHTTAAGPRLAVVAEGVNDHENLGALYRNAAAFGAGAVLLDPTCADPFYRRSVRVSLGHVLTVPTASHATGPGGVAELHHRGVTTVALSPGAEVDLRDVRGDDLGPGVVAVVVGAEGPGLDADTIEACQRVVSIPMTPGVDSLNVATAAAVALHHLSPRRRPRGSRRRN